MFDDEDDPNLHLPGCFITCFDHERIPMFEEAIRRYAAEVDADHQLEIDQTGTWNRLHQPALLWYKREGDLSAFWRIMDELKAAAP